MKLLAGKMIPVDFIAMMIEIIKLIIVPIGAAMLDECLEHASPRGRTIHSWGSPVRLVSC